MNVHVFERFRDARYIYWIILYLLITFKVIMIKTFIQYIHIYSNIYLKRFVKINF